MNFNSGNHHVHYVVIIQNNIHENRYHKNRLYPLELKTKHLCIYTHVYCYNFIFPLNIHANCDIFTIFELKFLKGKCHYLSYCDVCLFE